MIEFKSGDILKADLEALVNTVNCVGVMGRGIALQFKNAYPANYQAYEAACKKGEVLPGKMFVFRTGAIFNPKYIINFPTKRHWRGKSDIRDIESGLADLVRVIKQNKIRSIAIPPLGSGLGGLEWQDVKKRIENVMKEIHAVDIVVFEPTGAPASSKMMHKTNPPEWTPGRAALVQLISVYLDGLLDPFISLLEVHKLMYFMQEAGENLRLDYKQYRYGPYANNMRHVLNAIEGYFIDGYADGGDAPNKQLSLVPGAIEEANNFMNGLNETRSHLDRVINLVEGFESSFGLELLSTVHWVLKNDNPESDDEIVSLVYSWSDRKKKFTERQIILAANALKSKQWV